MKKLLLACTLAFAGLFNAQDKGLQGTWFATAQIGYQQTDNGNGGKVTNTTILPIVGTFVAPTTAVGVAVGTIGVKNDKANELGVDQLKTNLLVVEPLVRKYWNVSGGLFFFGQLAAPIINGKTKVTAEGKEISAAEVKTSQYGLALSGGFDYVLTKHFTIELSYNLANLSFTTIKNYPGNNGKDIKTTDFSLAHIATVAPEYNKALFGGNGTAVTPLSFGFKFLF